MAIIVACTSREETDDLERRYPNGRWCTPGDPYHQWTRKVAAKTVGRRLSPEQAADYQAFIDTHRRIRELFARLEAIGLETLEADPRTRRKS